MQNKNREYNKKWLSSKKVDEMTQIELEQFLTDNLVEIPFTNYETNDLKELCYSNNLVKSFTTRGRKKRTFTKFDLLKLCQKYIAEHNSEQIFEKDGNVTIVIKKSDKLFYNMKINL